MSQNRWLAAKIQDVPDTEDGLVIQRFSGSEEISRPFEFTLEMFSTKPDHKPRDIIGKNCSVSLSLINDSGDDKSRKSLQRFFNGMVARFRMHGQKGKYFRYSAIIVPDLWKLTCRSECRTFTKITVPDLVKQIFEQCGVANTDFSGITEKYIKRELVVQYRETHFNFISRLLEHEGISYYFTHENGKHTMHLTDSRGDRQPYPEFAKVHCELGGTPAPGMQAIREWEQEDAIVSGSYAIKDFDFTRPVTELLETALGESTFGGSELKLFEYAPRFGNHADPADSSPAAIDSGKQYAKRRIHEVQHAGEFIRGMADARCLAPGRTFEPVGNKPPTVGAKYYTTSVHHVAQNDEYGSGSGGAATTYQCRFTAIDANRDFVPARITPRPVIAGPQTAIVVGPSGQETYTDKFGRVMVAFHWDRGSKRDESSSCFVRVSQGWAGKGWGMFTLPRIGHEVIVEFLEGDPDYPIVTGRVYNAINTVPYELPSKAAVSTIKSSSTPEGKGFNELRFDDTKEKEQIFLHAQKDLEIRVLEMRHETVKKDRHLVVEENKFEHVKKDRNETVDANHKEKIGADRHLEVVGLQNVKIGKTLSIEVGDDVAWKFGKNHHENVEKDYYLNADNIVIEAKTNITLKVQKTSIAIEKDGIKIDVDGTFETEAVKAITITSKSDGITAEGTKDVSITSKSGNFSAEGIDSLLKGKASAKVDAAQVEVSGKATAKLTASGMCEISGSMVKIN